MCLHLDDAPPLAAVVFGNDKVQSDDAEQLITGWIGNGDRIRKLFCGIHRVMVAERDLGGCSTKGKELIDITSYACVPLLQKRKMRREGKNN